MAARLRGLVSRPAVVLVAGIALQVLFHAWFWFARRRGFPLHIDESGYSVFAMDDAQALRDDGVPGLWRAFRGQRYYAPLIPLLSVPSHLLVGDSVTGGYAVILAAFAGLVAATYLVARRLLSQWWAVVAALAVACVPQVVEQSRQYGFAVPATAFYILAIALLLRSDGLRRRAVAAAGGAALGLAALSRTMMLGFVIGPVLAAALHAVTARGDRRRRLVSLALSAACTVMVAGVWYQRHLSEAVGYLRDNPFEIRPLVSGDAAPGGPAWTPLRDLGQAVNAFYLPLALLAAAAGVATGVGALLSLRGRSVRRSATPPSAMNRVRSFLASDIGFLTVCVVQGGAVLRLANEAQGQWMPMIPLLVILVFTGVQRWRPPARVALTGAVAVVMTAQLLGSSGWLPAAGRERYADGGPLGILTWTDGRMFAQRRLHDYGQPGRWPASFREWDRLTLEVAAEAKRLADEHGQPPIVFVPAVLSTPMINVNALLLADRLLTSDHRLQIGVLDQSRPEEVRRSLTDPARGLPNVVVTPDRSLPGSLSTGNLDRLRRILVEEGFRVFAGFDAPDGRSFALWWRSHADAPPFDG